MGVDPSVAAAVVEAVSRQLGSRVLVAQAGTAVVGLARRAGLRVVPEGFPDRGYLADGRLAPRDRARGPDRGSGEVAPTGGVAGRRRRHRGRRRDVDAGRGRDPVHPRGLARAPPTPPGRCGRPSRPAGSPSGPSSDAAGAGPMTGRCDRRPMTADVAPSGTGPAGRGGRRRRRPTGWPRRSTGRAAGGGRPAAVDETVVGFGSVVVHLDPGRAAARAWSRRGSVDLAGAAAGPVAGGTGRRRRGTAARRSRWPSTDPTSTRWPPASAAPPDAVVESLLTGAELRGGLRRVRPRLPLPGRPAPRPGLGPPPGHAPGLGAGRLGGGGRRVRLRLPPGHPGRMDAARPDLRPPVRPRPSALRPAAAPGTPCASPPRRTRSAAVRTGRGPAPGRPAPAGRPGRPVRRGARARACSAWSRTAAAGRWPRLGVPRAGPADPDAMRLANRLVGNPDGAAAIEVTAVGPDAPLHRRRPPRRGGRSAPTAVEVRRRRPAGGRRRRGPGRSTARWSPSAGSGAGCGPTWPWPEGSRPRWWSAPGRPTCSAGWAPGRSGAGDRLDLGPPSRPHGLLSPPAGASGRAAGPVPSGSSPAPTRPPGGRRDLLTPGPGRSATRPTGSASASSRDRAGRRRRGRRPDRAHPVRPAWSPAPSSSPRTGTRSSSCPTTPPWAATR